jgi:hypothetical protein
MEAMTDEIVSPPKIPIQDITHQSLRLGRFLDRLPPGDYELELTKGRRDDPWRVVVKTEEGELVREFDLWK